jgi:hypothetical protein
VNASAAFIHRTGSDSSPNALQYKRRASFFSGVQKTAIHHENSLKKAVYSISPGFDCLGDV